MPAFYLSSLLAFTGGQPLWQQGVLAMAFLTGIPAVTAYIALNFTGSTPLTGPSEVAREMRRYIRPMAGLGILSALCLIATIVLRFLG